MRNYQVFINEHQINFSSSSINIEIVDNLFLLNQPSKNELKLLVDYLFEEKSFRQVEVLSDDIENLWAEFVSLFKNIAAAGGIVKNSEEKYLLIHRLEKWDLPKGKVEEGENKREAAIREVEEECGINQLEIVEQLPITFHMYLLKGEIILKPTYWFMMETKYSGKLTPQLEEDITKVEWCNLNDFKIRLSESYASLQNLIEKSEL